MALQQGGVLDVLALQRRERIRLASRLVTASGHLPPLPIVVWEPLDTATPVVIPGSHVWLKQEARIPLLSRPAVVAVVGAAAAAGLMGLLGSLGTSQGLGNE